MRPGDFAALLASAPFFDLLGADRNALLGAMEVAHFAAGEVLFARGDIAQALYVVVSGNVRLSVVSEDGRELTLLHASKGALFGEIGCFDGGARTADATALTAVEVLALQRRDLLAAMRAHAEIAQAIIQFLSQRLRATNDRLEAIAFHSVETRLALFLLSQARSAGVKDGALRLGLSQTEISLLIAASRPKVNAAFALLEEKGALRRVGKEIACDLESLARIAGVEI